MSFFDDDGGVVLVVGVCESDTSGSSDSVDVLFGFEGEVEA